MPPSAITYSKITAEPVDEAYVLHILGALPSGSVQHDRLPPSSPQTIKISRTYSEIVWLLTGRTASTSTDAYALTGLPNTYDQSPFYAALHQALSCVAELNRSLDKAAPNSRR